MTRIPFTESPACDVAGPRMVGPSVSAELIHEQRTNGRMPNYHTGHTSPEGTAQCVLRHMDNLPEEGTRKKRWPGKDTSLLIASPRC